MEILLRNAQRQHKIDTRAFKKQVRTLLESLDQENTELSLLITRDAAIRKLNRDYRDRDRATDVLSFPQDDGVNENGETLLGDVVISIDTAHRQAGEHGLTLNEELMLLTIHGLLHLLDYDHERSEEEARIMKRKTRELFQTVYPGKKLGHAGGF